MNLPAYGGCAAETTTRRRPLTNYVVCLCEHTHPTRPHAMSICRAPSAVVRLLLNLLTSWPPYYRPCCIEATPSHIAFRHMAGQGWVGKALPTALPCLALPAVANLTLAFCRRKHGPRLPSHSSFFCFKSVRLPHAFMFEEEGPFSPRPRQNGSKLLVCVGPVPKRNPSKTPVTSRGGASGFCSSDFREMDREEFRKANKETPKAKRTGLPGAPK